MSTRLSITLSESPPRFLAERPPKRLVSITSPTDADEAFSQLWLLSALILCYNYSMSSAQTVQIVQGARVTNRWTGVSFLVHERCKDRFFGRLESVLPGSFDPFTGGLSSGDVTVPVVGICIECDGAF